MNETAGLQKLKGEESCLIQNREVMEKLEASKSIFRVDGGIVKSMRSMENQRLNAGR